MLVNRGLKHSITTMGKFSFHLKRSVSHETNHCFGISSCGMAMILQRFFWVAKPIQFHSGVATKFIELQFFPDGFQHVSTVPKCLGALRSDEKVKQIIQKSQNAFQEGQAGSTEMGEVKGCELITVGDEVSFVLMCLF